MLLYPLALLLSLDDGLDFRTAGRPIQLLLCCAFLCQGVGSTFLCQGVGSAFLCQGVGSAFLCQGVGNLIAKHVAVGGNPLQNDGVTLVEGGKSGGQVVKVVLNTISRSAVRRLEVS